MLKKTLLLIISSIVVCSVSLAQITINIKNSVTNNATLPLNAGYIQRNTDVVTCNASKKSKHLFYQVLNNNAKVYYTSKGVCWHYITSKTCKDSIDAHCIITEESFEMAWVDNNMDVQMVAEDSTSNGFKRITYYNLFKNIDAIFNANLSKCNKLSYSFFVHAGATLSSIKLRCKSGKNIHHDPLGRGMFVMEGKSVEFIGHQPSVLNKIAGYTDFCRYTLSDDIISFDMTHNSSSEYIINPSK